MGKAPLPPCVAKMVPGTTGRGNFKLTDLNQQLKDKHLELFNQTYLAELECDLLNPHKPANDLKKPQPRLSNPWSEMYIDNKNPPTLSKDQATVHNHIFSFYNSLFSHKQCNDNFFDLQKFMEGNELDKVTKEENTSLEHPITKPKIADFIKTMSNDKAPGITGIIPALYKVFWSQIGDLVTKAINNCLNDNSFPPDRKLA